MGQELLGGRAVEFGEPPFREAPEGFDPVDVVLPAGELVLRMEHAVMVAPVQDEPAVRFPSVRIGGRTFEDFSLDHGHQFFAGTIRDDADENLPAALQCAENRRLSRGSAAPLSPYPVGAEIRFVDLHVAGEKFFFDGKLAREDFLPENPVETVGGFPVEIQNRRRFHGRKVLAKALQNLINLRSAEFAVFDHTEIGY